MSDENTPAEAPAMITISQMLTTLPELGVTPEAAQGAEALANLLSRTPKHPLPLLAKPLFRHEDEARAVADAYGDISKGFEALAKALAACGVKGQHEADQLANAHLTNAVMWEHEANDLAAALKDDTKQQGLIFGQYV